MNGHISNGPLPNGLPTSNSSEMGLSTHLGQQNHGFQHSQDTVQALNSYNNPNFSLHNGQFHLKNGQHTHGETLQANEMPQSSPNGRLNGHGNGQHGHQQLNGHHMGGPQLHSPKSNSSAPPDEVNNVNERREELRKDDRWGSLKKGLKYNPLKGILSGKFGRNDKDDSKNGQGKTVFSQGTNANRTSRENSPSKREKNTNIFQNGSVRLTNGGVYAGPIETDLSTPNVDSPSKQPSNGFIHGAPFRNSSVHFDLPPSSPQMTHQQRGGSTRIPNNPVQDNTLANSKRSGSFQQLTQQQQQQPLSQQQIWRQQQKQQQQQQNLHFSADNLAQAIPSDHTYGPNGRTHSAGNSTGKSHFFVIFSGFKYFQYIDLESCYFNLCSTFVLNFHHSNIYIASTIIILLYLIR